MASWADSIVIGPKVDLSVALGPRFAGILVPQADLGAMKVGITDQFLGDAQVYHDRYTSIPYWTRLITEATSGKLRSPPGLILDIGSGSGNSVLPCLKLFPDARIVATDLSETLLAILRDHLDGNEAERERTVLICLDATRADFVDGSVDLVLGAAILHHLLDPAPCVRRACSALRAGGLAIFFEPFEAGNAILRIAYERVLSENALRDCEHLSDASAHTLRSLVHDYRLRAGSDKSAGIFRQMDDKWLFTHDYFNALAVDIGDVSVEIEPLWAGARRFTAQTETNLRLAQGLAARDVTAALPGWAWDVLHQVDAAVSLELKRDLPVEARVTFRRESRAQTRSTT